MESGSRVRDNQDGRRETGYVIGALVKGGWWQRVRGSTLVVPGLSGGVWGRDGASSAKTDRGARTRASPSTVTHQPPPTILKIPQHPHQNHD